MLSLFQMMSMIDLEAMCVLESVVGRYGVDVRRGKLDVRGGKRVRNGNRGFAQCYRCSQ